MHDIDPEAAAGAFVAIVAAGIRIAGYVLELRNKRVLQKAASIPPTVLPVPDDRALRDELERANAERRRAQWRIEELEHQLREVGRDHARTASALTAERDARQHLEARVRELEDALRAIHSGHLTQPPHPRTPGSHPALPPVGLPVHVVEEDERKTPPQGTRGVRWPRPKPEGGT